MSRKNSSAQGSVALIARTSASVTGRIDREDRTAKKYVPVHGKRPSPFSRLKPNASTGRGVENHRHRPRPEAHRLWHYRAQRRAAAPHRQRRHPNCCWAKRAARPFARWSRAARRCMNTPPCNLNRRLQAMGAPAKNKSSIWRRGTRYPRQFSARGCKKRIQDAARAISRPNVQPDLLNLSARYTTRIFLFFLRSSHDWPFVRHFAGKKSASFTARLSWRGL